MKHRAYILFFGQNIPEYDFGKDVKIRKMDIKEQEKRKFSPIQGTFYEEKDYKTYMTSSLFLDPLKIVSEYVIIYDIDEWDVKSAIGAAIRMGNYISRVFTITNSFDLNSEGKGLGYPYYYQVNKIYKLDDKGNEEEVKLDLNSGHTLLPNRPDKNKWINDKSEDFMKSILEFKNPVVEKSLKYLYSANTGQMNGISEDKIALDFFKVIEIILDDVVPKPKKCKARSLCTFKERLNVLTNILNINKESEEKIEKFYNARNNNDIAHSSILSPADHYPNQFPVPTNNAMFDVLPFVGIEREIFLKYFNYIRRRFFIEIDNKFPAKEESDSFGILNDDKVSNHLFFDTNKKDIGLIKKTLETLFAENFSLSKSDFLLTTKNDSNIIIQVNKDVDIPISNIKSHKVIIF